MGFGSGFHFYQRSSRLVVLELLLLYLLVRLADHLGGCRGEHDFELPAFDCSNQNMTYTEPYIPKSVPL